jgi:hypothetical protein
VDETRFDAWTRDLNARGTRRAAIATLAAGAFAGFLTRLDENGTAAGKRGGGHKKKEKAEIFC